MDPVSGLQLCITVPSGWTGVQEHSVSAHSDWVVSGGGSGATTIVFTWPGTVPNNGYWDLSTIQVRAWDYLRHQPTQLSLVAFASGKSGSTAVTTTPGS